jgi:hypothetical protein
MNQANRTRPAEVRNNIVGSKYEATKDLGITEIAKLVRADIGDAIARGILRAGIKVSVRVSRYSGGQSLTANVTAVPAGFAVRVSDDCHDAQRVASCPRPWLAREAVWVLATVERLVEAYNYDRCHLQSDSFDVRFYAHIGFDSDVERANEAA